MKKLLLTLFALLAITSTTYAVELELSPYVTIPSDPENTVQPGMGIELKAKWDFWYICSSFDKQEIQFTGQRGVDIGLASLGVGFEYDLFKTDSDLERFLLKEGYEIEPKKYSFSAFADVGWYEPIYDKGARYDPIYSTHGEGLWRHMNKIAGASRAIKFEEYSSDYAGYVGAKVGVSGSYRFTDHVSLGVNVKYRYLQLEENLKGYDDPKTHGDWYLIEKQDFGGAQAGIFLNINFQKKAKKVVRKGEVVYIN